MSKRSYIPIAEINTRSSLNMSNETSYYAFVFILVCPYPLFLLFPSQNYITNSRKHVRNMVIISEIDDTSIILDYIKICKS